MDGSDVRMKVLASWLPVDDTCSQPGEHRRLVVPPTDAYGDKEFAAWGGKAAYSCMQHVLCSVDVGK